MNCKFNKMLRAFAKRFLMLIRMDSFSSPTWSQEGEDVVLKRIFDGKKNGFYVDVGAHHPLRFSNTYFFYLQGWSGINIDAMPGSMKLFNKIRNRDVNLEIGVAAEANTLDYFIFNEPALNGFSSKLSEARDLASTPYRIDNVVKVNVLPLSDILDQHVGEREIDFLNIDVEGLDFAVLKSNDWSRHRPKIVLVEILQSDINNISDDPVVQFMRNCDYVPYAKLVNTFIFKESSFVL